jgi:hypothetical protein
VFQRGPPLPPNPPEPPPTPCTQPHLLHHLPQVLQALPQQQLHAALLQPGCRIVARAWRQGGQQPADARRHRTAGARAGGRGRAAGKFRGCAEDVVGRSPQSGGRARGGAGTGRRFPHLSDAQTSVRRFARPKWPASSATVSTPTGPPPTTTTLPAPARRAAAASTSRRRSSRPLPGACGGGKAMFMKMGWGG